MTVRRAPRARFLLGAALCAAGMLAGCGDLTPTSTFGNPIPNASQAAVATPEPTAPPIETASPITFEPDPSDLLDTGSPGTPPCEISDLKASRGITEVDADERITEVVLVSAGTCSIDAWPTLLLEDAKHNILVAANAAGPGGIDLVPGVAYTSEVHLSNWCIRDPDYPVSIGILHGIETLLVTGDSFPDEGDLPACVHEDAVPELSGTAWGPKP